MCLRACVYLRSCRQQLQQCSLTRTRNLLSKVSPARTAASTQSRWGATAAGGFRLQWACVVVPRPPARDRYTHKQLYQSFGHFCYTPCHGLWYLRFPRCCCIVCQCTHTFDDRTPHFLHFLHLAALLLCAGYCLWNAGSGRCGAKEGRQYTPGPTSVQHSQ